MSTVPPRTCAMYAFGADAAGHLAQIEALGASRGLQLAGTYHDTRGTRPELKRLQAGIMAGEVDALMVRDLTELGTFRGARCIAGTRTSGGVSRSSSRGLLATLAPTATQATATRRLATRPRRSRAGAPVCHGVPQ
jgi:hypothetical protein